MTKAELKKSHDAMARLLIKLCRYSDETWSGVRDERCNQDYSRARRLIKAAGFPYKVKAA